MPDWYNVNVPLTAAEAPEVRLAAVDCSAGGSYTSLYGTLRKSTAASEVGPCRTYCTVTN